MPRHGCADAVAPAPRQPSVLAARRDRERSPHEVPGRTRRPGRRRRLGGAQPAGRARRSRCWAASCSRLGGPDGDRLTVSGFDYEVSARVEVDADRSAIPAGSWSPAGCWPTSPARCRPSRSTSSSTGRGSRSSAAAPGSACRPCRSRTTRSCRRCRSSPAPSTADVLAEAVAQVAVAAGRDDTLPMLTGIRLEIEGRGSPWPPPTGSGSPSASWSGSRRTPSMSTAVLVPARTLADVGEDPRRRGHASSSRCRRATACSASPAAAAGPPPGCSTPSSRSTASCSRPSTPRAAVVEVAGAGRGDQAGRAGHRPRSPRCGWSSPTDGLRLTAGGDDEGSAEEELPVRARRASR